MHSYKRRVIWLVIMVLFLLAGLGYFTYQLAINDFKFDQSGVTRGGFAFSILWTIVFGAEIIVIRRRSKREKQEDKRNRTK